MHGRTMPKKSSMKISDAKIASLVANSLVLSTIEYGILKNNIMRMLSMLRIIVSNNVNIGKLYDPLLYFLPGYFLWSGQYIIQLNAHELCD